MHNISYRLPFSMTTLCAGVAACLGVMYIGLIAIVMSYAAMTIEFSQSVRNDEAVVATLEAEYLKGIVRITNVDYAAAGYAMPKVKVFVPKKSTTALR